MIELIDFLSLLIMISFIIAYFLVKKEIEKENISKEAKKIRKFFILPIIFPKKFFKKEGFIKSYILYILDLSYLVLAIWMLITFISRF